jgi:GT2 family glycosyltransferase
MSISAVVPVWNGRDLLARLLNTLDAQTLRAAEVIAVDNGSSDGAPDLARDRGARVIPMGRNAGFAAAVNRGIREARSEWIAVLNTDVELAPDYLEACCRAAGEQPASPVWFVTGKILQAGHPELIDATFDLISRGATTWRAGSGRIDGPLFSKSRRIFSAPWTAAIFRAEIFHKLGFLEEQFESYLEDVDFGLRCAAHGLSGLYVPDAIAWHRGSASLGRWHPDTVRRIARNQLLLAARHWSVDMWWYLLVAQSLWGGVAVRHGVGGAWFRGFMEGLRIYKTIHTTRDISAGGLVEYLRQNERAIYDLQAATSFDTYWKLYFLFTGGGAK